MSVQEFNSRSSVCSPVWQHSLESPCDGQSVSQSCQTHWSSQTVCNSFSTLWWEPLKLLPEMGLFGFSLRGTKTTRLINEPGFFFSLSREVFKRKTAVSAEYRMSTLGITSNLSESTLWRGEDPLKSARVNMNFVWKELKSFLRTRNQSKTTFFHTSKNQVLVHVG